MRLILSVCSCVFDFYDKNPSLVCKDGHFSAFFPKSTKTKNKKNCLLAAQIKWPFGDSSHINCCHISVAAALTNKLSEESLEIGNLF